MREGLFQASNWSSKSTEFECGFQQCIFRKLYKRCSHVLLGPRKISIFRETLIDWQLIRIVTLKYSRIFRPYLAAKFAFVHQRTTRLSLARRRGYRTTAKSNHNLHVIDPFRLEVCPLVVFLRNAIL